MLGLFSKSTPLLFALFVILVQILLSLFGIFFQDDDPLPILIFANSVIILTYIVYIVFMIDSKQSEVQENIGRLISSQKNMVVGFYDQRTIIDKIIPLVKGSRRIYNTRFSFVDERALIDTSGEAVRRFDETIKKRLENEKNSSYEVIIEFNDENSLKELTSRLNISLNDTAGTARLYRKAVSPFPAIQMLLIELEPSSSITADDERYHSFIGWGVASKPECRDTDPKVSYIIGKEMYMFFLYYFIKYKSGVEPESLATQQK